MSLIDKILILLFATFIGLVFVLLQTYDFAKPFIDIVLTVTAIISFLLSVIEFFRKH